MFVYDVCRELSFLRDIPKNPFLDAIFLFLSYFDRIEFLFVLVPTIWVAVHWKAGMRLFYLLFFNNCVNRVCKALFASPRPYHLDPGLEMIPVPGFGFPSGAAQTAMLLSLVLLTVCKSRAKWVVAPVYLLAVSFSRLYLGVHFPSDIVGGWGVGLLVWIFYFFVAPRVEKGAECLSPRTLFFLQIGLGILLFCTIPALTAQAFSATAVGLVVGLFYNRERHLVFSGVTSWKKRVIRSFVAVGGVFLGYALLLPIVPLFVLFSLLGFWIATGSLWVFRRIE